MLKVGEGIHTTSCNSALINNNTGATIMLLKVTKKRHKESRWPALLTESLPSQSKSHVFIGYAYACLLCIPCQRYTMLYVIGSSTTLQVACTAHLYNNAYSTKTLLKLYSFFSLVSQGRLLCSGSALQSFHHCNCTV